MKTPYQYRAQAREVLQDIWDDAISVYFAIFVIASIISVPSVIGDLLSLGKYLSFGLAGGTTLLSLLIIPLQPAYYIALLQKARNGEETLLRSTVQQFTQNYSRLLLSGILISIIVSVLSIFTLLIGGIIFSYAYRMVPYLISDYPDLSATEAMKISREMMRGYKWKLFLLDFSFIGWWILTFITLGLGVFLLVPYTQTATAVFYEDLKAKTIVEEETV